MVGSLYHWSALIDKFQFQLGKGQLNHIGSVLDKAPTETTLD